MERLNYALAISTLGFVENNPQQVYATCDTDAATGFRDLFDPNKDVSLTLFVAPASAIDRLLNLSHLSGEQYKFHRGLRSPEQIKRAVLNWFDGSC